jgi:hypothetical protein
VLLLLPFIAGNDASNPSGGDHPCHSSHETGIDIDIPLPRTDHGGCGHRDHLHLRISPEAVGGGVRASTQPALAKLAAAAATPSFIRELRFPGGAPSDAPVDGPILATLAEPFDPSSLTAATVRVVSASGPVAGDVIADPSGLAVTFDPIEDLDLGTTYTFILTNGAVLADGRLLLEPSERSFTTEIAPSLRVVRAFPESLADAIPISVELQVTFDGPVAPATLLPCQGVTRPFPRSLRFATAPANLGFELGDLSGFEVEGDVEVVESFGPLQAPEGDFMAKLRTSDAAVDGRFSRLRAVDLQVPEGATRLAFTYNFLTDEIEQGQPFNDFFRATLVLPDGSTRTILTVTRDLIRFSGSISPVPGFDRMTGFRTGTTPVQAGAGATCHLVFEVLVSDAGDASIDSAVLIDNIRFE